MVGWLLLVVDADCCRTAVEGLMDSVIDGCWFCTMMKSNKNTNCEYMYVMCVFVYKTYLYIYIYIHTHAHIHTRARALMHISIHNNLP